MSRKTLLKDSSKKLRVVGLCVIDYYLFACNLKNHVFIYLIVLGRSCSVWGPWDLLVLAAGYE